MYRLLRANAEVRERRRQATHPAAKKPELIATGPNQIWSWDITKLLQQAKWELLYLIRQVKPGIGSRSIPASFGATNDVQCRRKLTSPGAWS